MQALLQEHMQIRTHASMEHMHACTYAPTCTHGGGKVLLPQHTWTVYMVPSSKPLITCSWDKAVIVWDGTLSALAVIRYRTDATSSNTSLGDDQVAFSARVPKLTTERLTGGLGTADKDRVIHLYLRTLNMSMYCIQVCVHILYITYGSTYEEIFVYTLQCTTQAVAGLVKRVVHTIMAILYGFVLKGWIVLWSVNNIRSVLNLLVE